MAIKRGIIRFFHIHAKISHLLILSFILSFFSDCSYTAKNNINSHEGTTTEETLFQVSTFNALLEGNYEGKKTFGELKKLGNFGIGSVQNLDGEMIALDGVFYQFALDGSAYPVSDGMQTPFAAVTFFKMDKELSIDKGPAIFSRLKNSLDSLITDKNLFYAIRIDGEFKSVKIRNVPAQKKPFRRLEDVIKKEQIIQEYAGINGTMVGFWYPVYTGGISISGYHFHFITSDRTKGGHVLDCSLIKGKIQIDLTPQIHVELLTSQNSN